MFCKECGTENPNNSIQCLKCNLIINNNLPLDGTERIKIIAFFALLILPLVWLGGSVVILVIIIASLYIMKKDKNFLPILKANKYIKIYLIVVTIIFITIGLIYIEYMEALLFIIIPLILSPILITLIDFLFFDVLKRHEKWIIENGLFSDFKNEKSIIEKTTEKIQSLKKEPQNSADELLKWAELKEKGVISNEEFQKIKENIVGGKL